MRCVTRKPPAMLIDASRMAAAPSRTGGDVGGPLTVSMPADDDDAADGVGDAHERRVERRRHIPDHLPADDAGQRKDGQMRQECGRRDVAEGEERGRDDGDECR